MKVKIETTPEDLQAARRFIDEAAMLLQGEPKERMTQIDLMRFIAWRIRNRSMEIDPDEAIVIPEDAAFSLDITLEIKT